MRGGLRVAVVGGSIAGCAAGAQLADAGHRVSVYERVPGSLAGRGIGIGTDAATMARLADNGLIDRDFPRVDVDVVRYLHRDPGAAADIRWIGDLTRPAASFDWSALYHHLRRRIPDADYRPGQWITATDTGTDIDLAGVQPPDLTVFADGYRSTGRRLIAPGAETRYLELVIWRGLVPEREVDVRDLERAWTRIVYPGGHGVAYLIPGPRGETAPGDRQVMWAYYLRVPAAELGTVLRDRHGRVHGGSVRLGDTDDAVTAALRARLVPVIPRFFLDLLDRASATSLQAIYAVDVDRTHRHRACLVGDAATVFPPFTGGGVLKALDDALGLRASLAAAPDVGAALQAWSDNQRRTAARLRPIAENTQRELVDRVPDMTAMSAADTGRWLAALHPGAPLRLAGT